MRSRRVTGKIEQSTAVGRWCVWLGTAALAVMACDRPEYTYSPDVPITGTGAVGAFPSAGGSTFAGSFGLAGSTAGGSTSGMTCEIDTPNGSPLLGKQTVSNQLPARASVYLQLTDTEVTALKATSSLLPPASAPTTPSQLDRLLSQLLTTSSELRKPLLTELIARFKVTRPAWPNPWALRLVDHAGTEHMNPVRVTFKPEAWIARIVDGSLAVVDVNNAIVSITSAVSEPERIAAIFYVVDDTTPGAIATCDTGKRELLIGNEDMVAEFSLGSDEILQRLDSDIQALQALFDVTRPCGAGDKAGASFHAFTLCETWDFFDASSNYQAYQWSLANPVESYRPTTQNLASLIQALQNDRFTPDPFVGAPLGVGGAGGDGAGGEPPTDGGVGPGGAPAGGAPN